MQNPDLPPAYIEKKPRGMSCFAKGCVFIAALVALFFIAVWGGALYFQHSFGAFVSDHPVPLPENTTTNEQYQAAMRKLQPLAGMDTSGQAAAPIEITADDLNALVAHDPRLADAKGKCLFAIPGNQLAVAVSIDTMDENATPSNNIHYLNARIIGGVDIANGSVRLAPRRIESLSGKELPGWVTNNSVFQSIMDGLNEGLNKRIRGNTDLADLVGRIASSRVEGGRLILTVAPPKAAAPAPEATPAPEASPVAAPTP